jgi:GNAT superfamily N-acetyltransferase
VTPKIRPFAGDYERLLALAHTAVPFDPEGNRHWLHHRRTFDESHRLRRHYQVDESGTAQLLAYGAVEQDPGDPRRFRLFVLAEPARLEAGIGDRLIDRLHADLHELGATTAWAREYGRDVQLLDFFRRQGFEVIRRIWDLGLPVAAIEEAGTGPLAITTLAAERARIDDALPRLHQVVSTLMGRTAEPDHPASLPFEYFLRWLDRPGLSPDAYFIARDGEAYAGVSVWTQEPEQPGVLSQAFTAVLPPYRARGLASALRRAAAAYARDAGYDLLVAHVPSQAADALAAHEKMGFRRRFEYVTLEKDLT